MIIIGTTCHKTVYGARSWKCQWVVLNNVHWSWQ